MYLYSNQFKSYVGVGPPDYFDMLFDSTELHRYLPMGFSFSTRLHVVMNEHSTFHIPWALSVHLAKIYRQNLEMRCPHSCNWQYYHRKKYDIAYVLCERKVFFLVCVGLWEKKTERRRMYFALLKSVAIYWTWISGFVGPWLMILHNVFLCDMFSWATFALWAQTDLIASEQIQEQI